MSAAKISSHSNSYDRRPALALSLAINKSFAARSFLLHSCSRPSCFRLTAYCPFTVAGTIRHSVLKAEKAKVFGYPPELNTLGDHVRAARLDRGLFQKDVAKLVGVCTNTVTRAI